MEGSYACNLNNRFELFLDDENDHLDLLAKAEQDKRKAGDKKDAKKDTKKKGLSKSLVESVKTIKAAVEHPKPLGRQNNGNPPAQAGGPPARGPRPNNFEKREDNFEAQPRSGERPPRPNRGPRGDAPRDGQRNFNRDGPRPGGGFGGRGREFDRRSGDNRSGVKSVEKRGGQGQFNWGSETEVHDQEVPTQEVREEGAEGEAAAEDVVPAEPEVVEMTLEQWKKEQAQKKSKAEYAANIRKPNEGEKDDPKLKKAVVLKKKKNEESDDAEDDAEESEDEGEKMKKALEQTLASQFHFAMRPRPGGRPDGPRPERRPDGPRPERRFDAPRSERYSAPSRPSGGSRGSAPKQQHTPRVEDLNDFPSLAA